MRRLPLPLLVMAVVLPFPSPAWCGDGSYKLQAPGPDRINLFARFEYLEPNVQSWKPLFQAASSLLYDATEKQVKISKVVVFNNCTGTRDASDVRILEQTDGRAHATGRLGKIGFISLFQIHKILDQDTARGQVGLVHEIGHYVFGLNDEYLDKSGQEAGAQGCIVTSGNDVGHASLMDAGTTIAGKNQRTEFCVESNHNEGNTLQDAPRAIGPRQILENYDSWRWLVRYAAHYYGAQLTEPAPGSEPEPDVSGFVDDLDFAERPCGVRLSLGIQNARGLAAVQGGLAKLVRLLEEDDFAGMVSTGAPPFLIQRMTIQNKFDALLEIPRLRTAAGDWTDLLRRSLSQVTGGEDGEGSPLSGEAIVLISDGGEDRNGEIAALLSAAEHRGVPVYALAVGAAPSSQFAGLRNAADVTKGSYVSASTATDVDAGTLTLLAKIKDRGIITAEEGEIPAQKGNQAGALPPFEIPIDRTTTASAVDFLLTWSGDGPGPEMTIRAPDNSLIEADAPNAFFQDDFDQKLRWYRIQNPPEGNWQVTLSSSGATARSFAFQAHSLAEDILVGGYAEDEPVAFSDPIVLKTVVSLDYPITGARVRARIRAPTGEVFSIELADDGSLKNRDSRAGDGTYSGVLEGYPSMGEYKVEITVDSAGGTTTSPGEPGGTFTPETVRRFVRKDRFSVVVTDAPD